MITFIFKVATTLAVGFGTITGVLQGIDYIKEKIKDKTGESKDSRKNYEDDDLV